MARLAILRRLHIWIACCAILLNALAPSISHAIAAMQGQAANAVEICRADGSAAPAAAQFSALVSGVDAALEPAPPGPESKMKPGQHCAYCLPHAGSFALPPDVIAATGIFGKHQSHPFLFYRSPQPLMAWSAARPRGPPAPA